MLNATDRSSRGRPGIEEGSWEGGGRCCSDKSFLSIGGKPDWGSEGN